MKHSLNKTLRKLKNWKPKLELKTKNENSLILYTIKH